ncbi:MAG: hypothetical protein A2068_01480 [Ignavibacteria bacterium GWB2_35_6b]|nr:MAG: hypothetical protein A2068_01480 [Ignavibacteria bacterium GWB2_35_6b]
MPEGFELHQNYPNPFNPSTKISYTIHTPSFLPPLTKGRAGVGFITLKIFDVLGREIATLVNEKKTPGTYEISFDATGFSSGVYYYKLTSGSFSQTKKMLLLR